MCSGFETCFAPIQNIGRMNLRVLKKVSKVISKNKSVPDGSDLKPMSMSSVKLSFIEPAPQC